MGTEQHIVDAVQKCERSDGSDRLARMLLDMDGGHLVCSYSSYREGLKRVYQAFGEYTPQEINTALRTYLDNMPFIRIGEDPKTMQLRDVRSPVPIGNGSYGRAD